MFPLVRSLSRILTAARTCQLRPLENNWIFLIRLIMLQISGNHIPVHIQMFPINLNTNDLSRFPLQSPCLIERNCVYKYQVHFFPILSRICRIFFWKRKDSITSVQIQFLQEANEKRTIS